MRILLTILLLWSIGCSKKTFQYRIRMGDVWDEKYGYGPHIDSATMNKIMIDVWNQVQKIDTTKK